MPPNSLVRRVAPAGALRTTALTATIDKRPSLRIPVDTLNAALARINKVLRGRLRDARLLVRNGGVVLRGTAKSYYAKQLSQNIIMREFSLPIAANDISVHSDFDREVGRSPVLAPSNAPMSRSHVPYPETTGVFDLGASALRLLIDHLPDAVIGTDRNGVIQVWNPAACELFGYSQDEAVGQNVAIIIPELLREAHRRGFEKAMTSGRTAYGGRAVTMRPIRKTGERQFVEFSFSVLRNREGNVFGAMAVARQVVGAAT